MATIVDGGAERRGLIYEIFVALAVENAFGSMPETGTKIDRVIADQDIIWPNAKTPKLVISVTHWGSHEAANKKFWRIQEDLFENHSANPKVKFCSVVFDRNAGSDQALCNLLDSITLGGGISDLNCAAIPALQLRVAGAAKLRAFGSGAENMLARTREMIATDTIFLGEIRELGELILAFYQKRRERTSVASVVLSTASVTNTKAFKLKKYRTTHFKPALIALINAGDFAADAISKYHDLDSLDPTAAQHLFRAGLVREKSDSLSGDLEPTDLLNLLFNQGLEWCKDALVSIQNVTRDTSHALYAYHDHIADVTDTSSCKERLKLLLSCKTEAELEMLVLSSSHGMNRVWPLDYAIAIQRSIAPSREYGVQKLSRDADIPYTGAPVSCPLPCYITGDRRRLSVHEVKKLSFVIFGFSKSWSTASASVFTIQADRKITLMKKLSVLDVLLETRLRKSLPSDFEVGPSIVRHALSGLVGNVHAGSTEFNIKISHGESCGFIFILSSFEATHKHKEISARLRVARAAGAVRSEDLCMLIVDGNILSDESDGLRVQMLCEAGWDAIYFFDELDSLVNQVCSHFGVKKTRRQKQADATIV